VGAGAGAGAGVGEGKHLPASARPSLRKYNTLAVPPRRNQGNDSADTDDGWSDIDTDEEDLVYGSTADDTTDEDEELSIMAESFEVGVVSGKFPADGVSMDLPRNAAPPPTAKGGLAHHSVVTRFMQRRNMRAMQSLPL